MLRGCDPAWWCSMHRECPQDNRGSRELEGDRGRSGRVSQAHARDARGQTSGDHSGIHGLAQQEWGEGSRSLQSFGSFQFWRTVHYTVWSEMNVLLFSSMNYIKFWNLLSSALPSWKNLFVYKQHFGIAYSTSARDDLHFYLTINMDH